MPTFSAPLFSLLRVSLPPFPSCHNPENAPPPVLQIPAEENIHWCQCELSPITKSSMCSGGNFARNMVKEGMVKPPLPMHTTPNLE